MRHLKCVQQPERYLCTCQNPAQLCLTVHHPQRLCVRGLQPSHTPDSHINLSCQEVFVSAHPLASGALISLLFRRQGLRPSTGL